MDFEQIVQVYIKDLSDTDKTILSYIINHKEEVSMMNISELEKKVYTSKATILRFTKKLGFSGFSEMRFFLKQSLEKDIETSEKQDIIGLQLKDIQNTIDFLSNLKLDKLLEEIYQCDTLYCYATGYYQRKALEEFYQLILTFEKRITVISDKREFDMIMPMIKDHDLVLFASVSGETENIKENIQMLKLRKIPLISVTTFGDNYISRNSNYPLYFYSTPVMVGKNPAIRNSMIGMNIVMDFLFRKYGEYIMNRD